MESKNSDNILVSIICTAYNHEPYIRKCLEGFVSQETNFAFEVIVHDDASTDRTADIIREYEEQYPDIIRPIYQTENKYQQGIRILPLLYAKVCGKYVAFCEGDDYWCDPLKLQLCVNALSADDGIVMAAHNTKQVSVEDQFLRNEIPAGKGDHYMDAERLIRGISCPRTSSFVMKAEVAMADKPPFFSNVTGDNAIRLHALTFGSIYYIDRVMSAYRMMVPGSWTQIQSKDISKRIKTAEKAILFYNEYDAYTDHKYAQAVAFAITKRKYDICALEENYKQAYMLAKELGWSWKTRVRWLVQWKVPFIRKLKAWARRQ